MRFIFNSLQNLLAMNPRLAEASGPLWRLQTDFRTVFKNLKHSEYQTCNRHKLIVYL